MAIDVLVETIMPRFKVEGFTDKEIDYYSRLIMLSDMGVEAQGKLKELILLQEFFRVGQPKLANHS